MQRREKGRIEEGRKEMVLKPRNLLKVAIIACNSRYFTRHMPGKELNIRNKRSMLNFTKRTSSKNSDRISIDILNKKSNLMYFLTAAQYFNIFL